jgi:hypothetical protein
VINCDSAEDRDRALDLLGFRRAAPRTIYARWPEDFDLAKTDLASLRSEAEQGDEPERESPEPELGPAEATATYEP